VHTGEKCQACEAADALACGFLGVGLTPQQLAASPQQLVGAFGHMLEALRESWGPGRECKNCSAIGSAQFLCREKSPDLGEDPGFQGFTTPVLLGRAVTSRTTKQYPPRRQLPSTRFSVEINSSFHVVVKVVDHTNWVVRTDPAFQAFWKAASPSHAPYPQQSASSDPSVPKDGGITQGESNNLVRFHTRGDFGLEPYWVLEISRYTWSTS
jgi:hypothetical protein